MIKNPLYDAKDAQQHELNGYSYYEEEFIEKEVPVTRIVQVSHIEYLIKCAHCQSEGWVKRKDAKYCSSNCRNLAYKERKKMDK